jgi:hypothetical protein
MSKTVWKNTPEGKTVKRNNVASQFGNRPLELMESPALRILSRAAHLALMRIEIELRHHGGRDNGKLPVTKQNFVDFGIHPRMIAPALRELEALGLIRITQRGRGGTVEFRQPNHFLVNFMCGAIDTRDEITNAWKRIKTMEEAEEIAAAARNAKDPIKVNHGKRTHRGQNKNRVQKVYLVSGTESVPETAKSLGTESVPTVSGAESVPTLDTFGRGASVARRRAKPDVRLKLVKPTDVWTAPSGVDREELLKILAQAPAFTAKPLLKMPMLGAWEQPQETKHAPERSVASRA